MTSFYSFTIISVTLDCSDVSMLFFTHISYIFWVYTSHFVSGFIICVQCKALSCLMQDYSFVLFCSKFILTETCRLLAQCYAYLSFGLCSAHFLFQLFVVTCVCIYCIMAVVVKFPIEHFFLYCHFCLRLTSTFGSHL